MSVLSHGPAEGAQPRQSLLASLVPEMWASIAIAVMWLAVLFDAIFGPDIVSSTPGGTNSSVPSAVVVSLFAFLGTWVVARYGFRARRGPLD
jgi:hypothetical protein